MKILVVEDDDVGRELMRLTLERGGYQVETASDGVSGFDLALASMPDLIVTDVAMPSADGAHLVRRVRGTKELETTPVIVTTGYGSGNATFVLMQGADAFEPKPIDPENLLATVRRLIGEK